MSYINISSVNPLGIVYTQSYGRVEVFGFRTASAARLIKRCLKKIQGISVVSQVYLDKSKTFNIFMDNHEILNRTKDTVTVPRKDEDISSRYTRIEHSEAKSQECKLIEIIIPDDTMRVEDIFRDKSEIGDNSIKEKSKLIPETNSAQMSACQNVNHTGRSLPGSPKNKVKFDQLSKQTGRKIHPIYLIDGILAYIVLQTRLNEIVDLEKIYSKVRMKKQTFNRNGSNFVYWISDG